MDMATPAGVAVRLEVRALRPLPVQKCVDLSCDFLHDLALLD